MKTLNVNIIYQVKTSVCSGNKYEYKIYISVNIDNESIFVYSGYKYLSCYQDMIDFCLHSVLNYTNTKLSDYSTFNPNVINFDF